MRASGVISVHVTAVPPDLPLEHAHSLMQKLKVRHLPVVSQGKLAGMLSDRDVLLAVGGKKDGHLVYLDLTAGEAMSLSPIVAPPDASVGDLARAMVENRIDAVPIVSERGELVGMVTSTDLLALLGEQGEESQPKLSFQIHRVDNVGARA